LATSTGTTKRKRKEDSRSHAQDGASPYKKSAEMKQPARNHHRALSAEIQDGPIRAQLENGWTQAATNGAAPKIHSAGRARHGNPKEWAGPSSKHHRGRRRHQLRDPESIGTAATTCRGIFARMPRRGMGLRNNGRVWRDPLRSGAADFNSTSCGRRKALRNHRRH